MIQNAILPHTAKFPEFSGSYLLACARYPPGGGGCLEGIWEFSKILGKFGNLLNPGADARFQKKVAAKPPEIKER